MQSQKGKGEKTITMCWVIQEPIPLEKNALLLSDQQELLSFDLHYLFPLRRQVDHHNAKKILQHDRPSTVSFIYV